MAWARGIALAAAAILSAASPAESEQAEPAAFAPYRGYYSLTLDGIDGPSRFRGVEGALVLEWAETCKAWHLDQQMRLVLDATGSGPVVAETRYVAAEAKDGRQYRFKLMRVRDGAVVGIVRGRATRARRDAPGFAEVLDPQPMRHVLPVGTAFPAAHLQALVARARAGATSASGPVFDGLAGADAVSAYAVITAQGGDSESPSWRLDTAFHRADTVDGTPDYEARYDLDAEGRVTTLTLAFGGFDLVATLDHVDALPRPRCDGGMGESG